jgi:CheY-like chemotaxis protein
MAETRKAVLLIEDDEAYRYSLAKQLQGAGFDVVDMPDSLCALTWLDTEPTLDLLIADIRLPKDTPHGYALARMARLKQPKLPVLFITAYDAPREEKNFDAKIISKQLGLDMIVLEAQRSVGAAS